MNRRTWLAAAGAAALSIAAGPLRAAAPYPNRPIRLVVPFLPGSSPDNTARALASELGPLIGETIVVENVPGAGGIIGANVLKRAAPDGYTLGILANAHVINIHTYPNLPYDPTRDFTSIAAISGGPTVLAVPAAAPYGSAQELIAAMKQAPDELNFGSGGKGSIAHLAVELLLHQTGTRAMHIPYKGATELIPAMLSGQTHFGMPVLGTAVPYLRSGQLRALAVSSSERSPFFPEVPTLAEVLPPGYVIDNWSGLFAPAHLPDELTRRLFAGIAKVQAGGGLDDLMNTNAGELRRSTSPAQFGELVASETQRYGKLMGAIGMSGLAS